MSWLGKKILHFPVFFPANVPLPACFCALCSTMITTLISNQSRIDFTFTSTCHRNFCSFWHQAGWQQLKTTAVWWTEHHYCNNWYISTWKSFDGSEQVGWQQLTSRCSLPTPHGKPVSGDNMKHEVRLHNNIHFINKSKLRLLLKNINIIFEIKQLRWLSIIFNQDKYENTK